MTERWKIEVEPVEPDNCGLVTDPKGEWVLFNDHIAAVDAVMAEAVLFAAAAKSDIVTVGTVKRAEAFLASDLVAEWRERQKAGQP